MNYEFTWTVEKRIIYARIFEEITLDDVTQIVKRLNQMIREGDQPVHILCDLRETKRFPMNLRDVVGAVDKSDQPHNSGWSIIISSNSLIRFLGSVAVQLSGARAHVCTDIETAFRYIAARDGSFTLENLLEVHRTHAG
ncbi:MAG: hypothetical protein SGI73_17410 [Chloroflexota bacterium]|nr:hypothetical protein [Chloroflexota bacterium]